MTDTNRLYEFRIPAMPETDGSTAANLLTLAAKLEETSKKVRRLAGIAAEENLTVNYSSQGILVVEVLESIGNRLVRDGMLVNYPQVSNDFEEPYEITEDIPFPGIISLADDLID